MQKINPNHGRNRRWIGLLAVLILLLQLGTPVAVHATSSDPRIVQAPAAETCGKTGSETILFIANGVGENPKTAESIKIVKLDYDNAAVTILDVPRELVINVGDNVVETMQLGDYFAWFTDKSWGNDRVKENAAVKRIKYIFETGGGKIRINHYISMNLATWTRVMDEMDGLTVDLPEAFVAEDGTELKSGRQVLKGDLAVEYALSLLEESHDDEGKAQRAYIDAITRKFMSIEGLLRMPALSGALDEIFISTISTKAAMPLLCMADAVDTKDIKIVNLPEDLTEKQPDGSLKIGHVEFANFLGETFNSK